MVEDTILKLKLSDDHVVQVGDTGKTVVRSMDGVTSADDMELNFFYARDYDADGSAVSLGEIKNIQVEPEWDGNVSKLQAGDTFVFGTPNLLD